MAEIGLNLVKAFEAAFNSTSLVDAFTEEATWVLLCASYPPTPDNEWGVAEHTDLGFLECFKYFKYISTKF